MLILLKGICLITLSQNNNSTHLVVLVVEGHVAQVVPGGVPGGGLAGLQVTQLPLLLSDLTGFKLNS